MNEVKEICAVMLDDSEPPLRAGDEVLALARRTTRGRTARRLIGAGAGGAGLAGLLAAALITPGVVAGPGGGSGSARDGAEPSTRTAPPDRIPDMLAAARVTLPDLPSAEQIQAHGDQIYRILSGAVPAGYQAERRFGADKVPTLWFFADDSVSLGPGRFDPATAQYVAVAELVIGADGREGGLGAAVWGDRRPAPTGDLCSAEVNTRMDRVFGPAESCQVITIGGLPMRVTTHRDPHEMEVVHATWFVRNGFVTVSSRQGLPKYEPDTRRPPDAPASGGHVPPYRPPLVRPLFDAEQLATVAANPDLLP